MRGLNQVQLIGNLGADPEVRNTASGTVVANVRLATNFAYTSRASGERVETTEWHRVVVFGKLAENVGKYLKKGAPAFVQGRLRTRSWEDQSGVTRYATEVIANDVIFLGSANGSGNGNGASTPAPAPASDDFEDDIPF
ncbi:MAG: single-stranded DNA-binding protein [Gammaproteobacteria bacterium]|nr:single-stranded DNA-binding protein [Gammaproteobacteria bacterium]